MATQDDKEQDLKRLTEEPGFGPAGSDEYQPSKNLNFTDDQGAKVQTSPTVGPPAPEQPQASTGSYMKDLFSRLGQRVSDNLAKSNQLQKDNSDIMMDRLSMSNPNKVGPRLPPIGITGSGMLPQEKAYGEAMANGMMGSMAPVGEAAAALAPEAKAVLAKSVPWMKGITQEAVDSAIPVGEGLVNSAGNSIAKQAAIAQQKFRNLQRMLRR